MHEIDHKATAIEAKSWRCKPLQIAMLCLSLGVISSAQAGTISIADVNTTDANAINDQTQAGDALFVKESYGEKFTIPYRSHDGNAVINSQGGYFDKVVTVKNWDPNVNLQLNFDITNQTKWSWSDYHFEFWNRDFTQRLDLLVLGASSDIFSKKAVSSTAVEFWAPNWQQIGQTGHYTLTIAPNLSALGTETFGIRQVATVPEPETYAMLLAGLGLLGAISRRRKS